LARSGQELCTCRTTSTITDFVLIEIRYRKILHFNVTARTPKFSIRSEMFDYQHHSTLVDLCDDTLIAESD